MSHWNKYLSELDLFKNILFTIKMAFFTFVEKEWKKFQIIDYEGWVKWIQNNKISTQIYISQFYWIHGDPRCISIMDFYTTKIKIIGEINVFDMYFLKKSKIDHCIIKMSLCENSNYQWHYAVWNGWNQTLSI